MAINLYEIARGAIENHIGDVVDSESSQDTIYEEAFTIALDALIDHGIPIEIAGPIASRAAQELAQP
jgi:hypothetical protein